MRVGFDGRDAYNMYRPLAKEVLGYYNYEYDTPQFRAFDYLKGKTPIEGFGVNASTFADTWFANPETREIDRDGPAGLISFNTAYLPYMYEDELIGIILHELAHVVSGFWAQHNREWAKCSNEVGGHDQPFLIPRLWEKLPEPLAPHWLDVEKTGIYYA